MNFIVWGGVFFAFAFIVALIGFIIGAWRDPLWTVGEKLGITLGASFFIFVLSSFGIFFVYLLLMK